MLAQIGIDLGVSVLSVLESARLLDSFENNWRVSDPKGGFSSYTVNSNPSMGGADDRGPTLDTPYPGGAV